MHDAHGHKFKIRRDSTQARVETAGVFCKRAGAARGIQLEVEEERAALAVAEHPPEAIGRAIHVHEVLIVTCRVVVLVDVGLRGGA